MTDSKRKRLAASKQLVYQEHYASLPIITRNISSLNDVPENTRDLVRMLRKLGKGQGVLLEQHREWLQRLQSGSFDEDEDNRIFAYGDAGTVRDRVGKVPTVEWAERIRACARENSELGASEAAWNCDVHSPLLAEALYCSPYATSLCTANITTARIYPASLLLETSPAGPLTAQGISKKMEFCVALKLEKPTEDAVVQAGTESLNHTDYTPVLLRPIAVSMETQAVGTSDSEALLQLTTWGRTQLKFLKSFRSNQDRLPIPPLPMILVTGHVWKAYFLHIDPHQSGQTEMAILWEGHELGQTNTVLGIFSIVACLQYLYEWVHTEYRPWFEKDILQPLMDGVGVFAVQGLPE